MQIGILSDTHLELHHTKNEAYPKMIGNIKELFEGVDHIIHAGDVCVAQFLRDLEEIAPITYCRGNCDTNSNWPRKQIIKFNKIAIGIAHMPEDIQYFDLNEIKIFIHGHLHYPLINESPEGVTIICPGSLLNPRPRSSSSFRFLEETKPRPSVAFLTIEDEQVSTIIKKL